MKFSLVITLAILTVAVITGWHNHGELATATRDYEQVRQQARVLGITESSSTSTHRTRSQPSRQLDVKSLATDLIAFAKELKALPEPPDSASLDEREQRMLDWQRRLSALEPAAMKALIEEIKAADGMEEESRQDLLFLVLQTLAETHPLAALEVLAEFPDLLKNPGARANAAAIALVHGMETDPSETITWYKSHRDLFPGQAGVWVTERLLRGTSLINPKVAFQLIGELEMPDVEYAVRMIANPARNSAEQDATLAAFREYLTTIQDPTQRETLAFEGISSMISVAFFEGFDKGIAAIGNGRFTPEEIETYAGRVFFNSSSGEAGKWIDWLIKTIPTDNITSRVVPQLFSNWTHVDYQAAGEWLTTAADGPAKTAATATYASAIAPYHPSTAAEWAMTLPPGQDRDRILPHIYQSWSKTDPAAAAAFAERNGIGK